jgi:hypothetical protein
VFRKLTVFAGLLTVIGLPAVVNAADEQLDVTVRDLTPYYEKEGVNLADYSSILIDTLGLDDARIVRPPWYEGEEKNPKKWTLSKSDIKWLRQSYRDTMTKEIAGNDGFPVVEEPGDGVLILDIEVIYLMPYAERGEKVTTRGFGEMLVQAQFRDGMTGELLAVYEGKQDVGTEYQQNTRLNNENRLLDLFRYWGKRVRGLMDLAHES